MFSFLLILAFVYTAAYLAHPSLPGNQTTTPLGWWGWFDQGRYLVSAKALAHFDFLARHHTYPIAYPFLGSWFVRLWPMHAFYFPDLLLFIWVAYAYVKVAEKYLGKYGRVIAMALFLITSVFAYDIFQQYIIPWNSTLMAGILATLILWLQRTEEDGERTTIRVATGFTFLAGVAILTRPVDVIATTVLSLAFFSRMYWVSRRAPDNRIRWKWFTVRLAGYGVGGVASLLLYAGTTLLIYRSLKMGYFSSDVGFTPANIVQKGVSLLFDDQTLYFGAQSALVCRFPWLLLAIAGVVKTIVSGPRVLRAVSVAITMQLLAYLAYNEFWPSLPVHMMHYIAWMFPWLGLMTVVAVVAAIRSWIRKPGRSRAIIVGSAVALLIVSGVHYERTGVPIRVIPEPAAKPGEPDHLVMEMLSDSGKPEARTVSMIDFNGLPQWNPIPWAGMEAVANGRPLTYRTDYEDMETPWGARMLLTRPTSLKTMRVQLAAGALTHAHFTPFATNYHFTLGWPTWLTPGQVRAAAATAPYKLGDVVRFTLSGDSAGYRDGGWSGPEQWGTWSDGHMAALRLLPIPPPTGGLELVAEVSPFIGPWHPTQRVDVSVNGTQVARWTLTFTDVEHIRRECRAFIPASTVRGAKTIHVVFHLLDPASPASFGHPGDTRDLGIGLIQFRLDPK